MRKKNSIKNFITSTIPFFILILLGFWKINVWQGTFSTHIYAINQLFFQIFAYLSIAEAGIGAIVQKEYYKLLIDDDKDTIRIFFTLSRKMLRKICCIILALSFLISFFIPQLTKGNTLSPQYMQSVFMLFVLKSLIEYMMFSPRFVLQADQKLFKINVQMNLYKIIEMLFEIFLVKLGVSYEIVLFITLIIRLVTNIRINKIVYKEYRWLKPVSDTKNFKITGMSHILIYKLVSVVYENIDIVLISSFVSPFAVIIYSNYKYITKYLSDMIYVLGNSIVSSMGNLLYSNENSEEIFNKYEMINTMFYFLACYFTITLGFSIDSFISIWVGSEKVLDRISFTCIMFLLFHTIARRPQYMLKDIFVLYKDLQLISVIETIINLVLSFIMVQYFGIKGVLLATVIATLTTNFWYFPKTLYDKVFNKKPFLDIFKYVFSLFIAFFILYFSFTTLSKISSDNYLNWAFNSFVYSIVILVVLFVIFWFVCKSFRNLFNEFLILIMK